ncbi:MAG: hypothetical protein ABSC06_17060 [Rhodopila sp.]|jgi:hypothetical protein
MAEPHVLSALRTKYAELDGELRQIEQRAEQLRADRDTIGRSILIFDPTAQPQEIQPKARRQKSSVFKHGEFARVVRDLLRRAGKPMSLRDIADQMIAEHKLDMEVAGARAKLDAKIRTLLLRTPDVVRETRDGIPVWRIKSEL